MARLLFALLIALIAAALAHYLQSLIGEDPSPVISGSVATGVTVTYLISGSRRSSESS